MSNINLFLRENLRFIAGQRMHVAPNIEEKKLNNAVKCFGYSGSSSNIAGLFDNTLLGSGKDGLLFTGEQVIYRPSFSDPIVIEYQSISDVEFVQSSVGNDGKKQGPSVVIKRETGRTVIINDLQECNYRKLAELLTTIYMEFDDYKEESQLVTIEELSETLKVAYLKVIINMAYDNDGVVDEKEYAEILLLMTRLNLSAGARIEIRGYMSSIDDLDSMQSLMQVINQEAPDGHGNALHISLVKDLINVHLSTSGETIDEFQFLNKYRAMLSVTDDEIQLAVDAIKTDHKMLKEDVTDDQLVTAIKMLSAKAAAVGTPLAAVYISGSVVGMSAAGITSGLASLGMGGILGLSGMTTGIGVAVLIGVGAYTGIRKLTGANEITRSKRRELMLHEVIKQTQKTISLLIEDINFMTSKLNDYISSHGAQDAQIKKLMMLMSKMTSAGSVLAVKSDQAQCSVSKIRCARFLNINKLKMLTRDPSKEYLYEYIISFYQEQAFTEEKDGGKIEVVKLVIKPGFTSTEIESLAKSFEAIGYFDSSEVIKSNVGDAASKAKAKLSGFFHE